MIYRFRPSCYGCNSKNLCMTFFLEDYFRSDKCPCGVCLVKMICTKRASCKDHHAFWKGNVREGRSKNACIDKGVGM